MLVGTYGRLSAISRETRGSSRRVGERERLAGCRDEPGDAVPERQTHALQLLVLDAERDVELELVTLLVDEQQHRALGVDHVGRGADDQAQELRVGDRRPERAGSGRGGQRLLDLAGDGVVAAGRLQLGLELRDARLGLRELGAQSPASRKNVGGASGPR